MRYLTHVDIFRIRSENIGNYSGHYDVPCDFHMGSFGWGVGLLLV